MTFIVETGSGNSAANSYVSLVDANAIQEGNIYKDEWEDAADDEKKIALVMATRVIDSNVRFTGFRTTTVQALEWPRIGVRNHDHPSGRIAGYSGLNAGLQGWNYFAQDIVPPIMRLATALLALDLLRTNRTLDPDSKGIASLSLGQGAISLTFSKGDSPMPISDEVQRLLSKIGSFRFGNAGSARIRRVP